MTQLLYLYAERHPFELQNLIRQEITKRFKSFMETSYESPETEIKEKLSIAEFVLMAPGRFLSDELHDSAKQVRMFQLWSSGYDKINQTKIRNLGQVVCTNGGANRVSVAEHTLLLMLAAARRLPEMHERVIRGAWEGNGHGMNLHTLNGKTVGIIGLGAIGKEVAKLCLAFGMKVTFYDPGVDISPFEPFEKIHSLRHLMKNSDFVSLHTHHEPGSRPILSKNLLEEIKKGAILINTAREELIEIDTLLALLKAGSISFYGADVFRREPTNGSEPILNERNVVLTPHIAGSNIETYLIALQNCLDNIERVEMGKQPLWRVI